MDTHKPVEIPGPHPAVVFDCDDTLWFCGRHYEEAKTRLYELCARITPTVVMPSRDAFVTLFDRYDATVVASNKYPIKERFPRSLGAFYELWCKENSLRCDALAVHDITQTGYAIYDMVFEAMPGACQMLDDLSHTHDLYAYTCGDQDIQVRRILAAGFDHYFTAIGVPERKTARPLTHFMVANRLNTRDTWVVGNSLKSDIAPALEVGIPASQCILVQSYSWSADEAEISAPIHVVHRLDEVTPIIQKVEVLV